MTNTNQPLYKQLNEQRTQGEWKRPEQEYSLNEYSIITDDMTICTALAIDIPDEEAEANVAYTCLAVNNLHILAEALENVLWNFEGKQNLSEVQQKAVQYAKEALNRIS